MHQVEYCCTSYFRIILRAVVSIVSSFHINHNTLQEIQTLNVCASPLPASRARTVPRACSARRGSACQAASRTRTALSTSAAFRGSACVSICAFFSTGFPGHTSWQVEIYCTCTVHSRVSDPDPYPDPHGSALFELLDPDPDPHTNCGSGSGSRRAKMTPKN